MQSASELELVGERAERYIILRESILTDSRFTLGEKFFIARISGFKTYHETNEHCAEFLSISIATIKRAKAKLIELGVLEEIDFDGKKKTFAVRLERLEEETFEPAQKDDGSIKATSRFKMSHLLVQNEPHKINNNIKTKLKKNIDSEESILAESGDEPSKKFGREDINEALEQWKEATGFDYSSNATERRAIYNLLRRKDVQSYGGFKALVSMVKSAGRVDNQFAPKIVKPSELGGKYSKLERLVNWSKKNEQRQSNPIPQRPWQSQPDTRIIGTYYKPHPEVVESRPVFMTQEQIEEERKQRHEEAQKVRAKFEQMMSRIKRNKESE